MDTFTIFLALHPLPAGKQDLGDEDQDNERQQGQAGTQRDDDDLPLAPLRRRGPIDAHE